MGHKVSVLIPFIRGENIAGLQEMILLRAGIAADDFEIIVEEDTERIGCPLMLERLVQRARYDIVCFLGDDTEPQEGFLKYALEDLSTFEEGVALIGLSDMTGRTDPCHWVASKRLLQFVGGQFFHAGYKHSFCDTELMERAVDAGKFSMSERAVVLHNNPRLATMISNAPRYDDTHKFVTDNFQHDKRLFYLRKTNGWETPGDGYFRLAVALPVVDARVHLSFMLSFMNMHKPPEYKLNLPVFPTGEFARDIAAVRNRLTEQSIRQGASHVLFCDTDQIYPPDTCSKLLSHGKKVVGALVNRRYPPFDPILLRGVVGAYKHVPDDECYSGGLVPVDATGLGCVLIDLSVLDWIKYPWFEIKTGEDGEAPVGEDIMFCSKLRRAGVGIYVDTSAKVGHMTDICINEDWYRLFKKIKGFGWASA